MYDPKLSNFIPTIVQILILFHNVNINNIKKHNNFLIYFLFSFIFLLFIFSSLFSFSYIYYPNSHPIQII